MSAPSYSDATRQMLEERTRRLAQPIVETGGAESIEMVVLPVDRERYGIAMRYVLEVLRDVNVAPVPGLPDIVAGVVNRRGTILPVFDLRRLFDRPAASVSKATVVVLGGDRAEFGLLADSGTEIAAVSPSEIVADALFSADKGAGIVMGTTPNAVVVLDGDALMKDQRLFIGQGEDDRHDGGG